MRNLCLSLFIVFGVSTAPVETKPAYAIKDAKIYASPGKWIEKGTVIVRDGIIESIGSDVTIPFDAQVIDAAGLILYPGFIDAHNHLGINAPGKPSDPSGNIDYRKDAHPESVQTNRKGIWAELQADEFFSLSEKDGESLRQQGFTAVLSAPKDGLIAGRSAIANLSGEPRREALIRSAAAMHASFNNSSEEGYPSALMGIIAHLRQFLSDTGYYGRDWAWYESTSGSAKRPPVDPALEAMRPVLAGKLPLIFEVNDENNLYRALALCDEFHIRPILSGGREAWKLSAELSQRNLPVIVGLDFGKEPKKPKAKEEKKPETGAEEKKEETEKEKTADEPAEPGRIYEDRLHKWEEKVSNCAQLTKAGIKVALTTKGSKNPEEFIKSLRKAIEKGFPKDDAIAALTINPAKIFGLEKERGTIEAGKLADFSLFTEEIDSEKAKIRYLFVEGKKFDFEKDKEKDKDKDKDKKDKDKKEEKSEEKPAGEGVPTEVLVERPVELDSDRVPSIKTQGSVLIRNATILTATLGRLENCDLLVIDGKISKVEKNIALPRENFPVIDASGKFVTPGLIDCHSHMAIDGGVNEGSLSITAECRIGDVVDPNDVEIYRALAGGITAAHLLHGSANVIGGQDATIKMKYKHPVSELRIQDAPQGIKFALGENPKQSNWGNRGTRFPNTRMGVEAVLYRAFKEAQDYQENWDKFLALVKKGENPREPRRDFRLETLAGILSGRVWVHSHCYRADEILMLMRVAEAFGWRVKTFQHVLEGYRVALEMARHGVAGSTFSDWWAYKIEAYEAIPYNGALMTEAGVNVSFNSDSDEMVRRMYHEAAKAVKYGGLSEEAALAYITINPAIQLGVDHRMGSIEVGKDADIAIFDQHPFSVYAKCMMTLIEGEVYFERKDLWKEWEAKKPRLVALEAAAVKECSVRLNNSEGTQRTKVIFGGTIYPVSAPPIENGMVIVRGDRIAEIGKNLPIPENAEIIEATGLRVYPGMIDSGTQLGLIEIGSVHGTNDTAEIGDIQPDLRISNSLNPFGEHIPVTRVNGITTALSRPTGGLISGQSALIHLNGWAPADMVVKDSVAMHVSFPNIRERNDDDEGKKDDEADNRIKELKEQFERAKEYGRVSQEARSKNVKIANADLRLDALAPFAQGKKPVIIRADREKQIRRAIQFADEMGLKIMISGGRDAWRIADLLAEKKIPVLVGPVHDLPSDATDPYDAPFHNAAVLSQRGVKFAFQTQESSNVRNLPYQAGMAAAYGLSPEEALKAVTIYPAEIFDIQDQVGSLDAGKLADLIVTDGDPLEIRTQIKHVLIAGEDIPLESKHTQLYQKFRKHILEMKAK